MPNTSIFNDVCRCAHTLNCFHIKVPLHTRRHLHSDQTWRCFYASGRRCDPMFARFGGCISHFHASPRCSRIRRIPHTPTVSHPTCFNRFIMVPSPNVDAITSALQKTRIRMILKHRFCLGRHVFHATRVARVHEHGTSFTIYNFRLCQNCTRFPCVRSTNAIPCMHPTMNALTF